MKVNDVLWSIVEGFELLYIWEVKKMFDLNLEFDKYWCVKSALPQVFLVEFMQFIICFLCTNY